MEKDNGCLNFGVEKREVFLVQERAFLIVLKPPLLESTLRAIDFNQLEIDGIVMDSADKIQVQVGGKSIPMYSFADIEIVLSKKDDFCLLVGYYRHMREIGAMAKILHNMGIVKDKIINFTIYLSDTYLGNLKYALSTEKLDFFATGISYMEVGLDINSFIDLRGVNLASTGQDLYYGYQTAKYVLAEKSVRFCLIGLCPYSFLYDIRKFFSANFYQLQYDIAGFPPNMGEKINFAAEVLREDFKDRFKYIHYVEDADPNYKKLKEAHYQTLTGGELELFVQELKDVSGIFDKIIMERNVEILRQYLLFCHKKHVRPICVVLPFSPILHDNYPADKLALFRTTLYTLLRPETDMLIDLFDENLGYEYFYDLSHLNQLGAIEISRRIAGYIKD